MDRHVDRPPPAAPFTAPERELIRRELGLHFGQYPSVTEGLFLRTWRGGPHKGAPKLPPAVQSLLARGLVEVRPGRIGFRAVFTEAGLVALRALVRDRRAMEPGPLRPPAPGARPGGPGGGR